MTLAELATRTQSGEGAEKELLELYNRAKPFCLKIARQYLHLLHDDPTETEKDLAQEAFLSVRDAAESFDPDAGAGFLHWLEFFLRRQYEDFIGRQGGGSAGTVRRLYAITRFEAEFTAKEGRYPSDKEICRALHIGRETLHNLRNRGKETSLNSKSSNDEDAPEIIDGLPDNYDMADAVIERITREEVLELLKGMLRELPEDERQAAYLFYILGKTDKQSAAEMAMDPAAFILLRQKALRKLRTARNIRKLGRYLPERLHSEAYHNGRFAKWSSSTERVALRMVQIAEREAKKK